MKFKAENGIIGILVAGIVIYIIYKVFFTSGGFMGVGGGGGGNDPLKNLLTKLGLPQIGGGSKTTQTSGVFKPTPIATGDTGGSRYTQAISTYNKVYPGQPLPGVTTPIVPTSGQYGLAYQLGLVH
jgi:hypothetical protein